MGNAANGLDGEVVQFLYGGGRDPRRLSRLGDELAAFLAGAFCAAGYVGPVGVDALIYRDGEQLRLKPVVEINPRYTMGRVAFKLRAKVNSARAALWLILSRREVESAGYADWTDFSVIARERWPVILTADGQLSEGVLLTSDAEQARDFMAVLLVAQTLEECGSVLREMGLQVGV